MTLPLSLVIRKNPAPAFCFWSTAPLNGIGLPPLGGMTDPLNRPVLLLTLTESLLSLWLRMVFWAVSSMALVKSGENWLFVNASVALVILSSALVRLGGVKRQPISVVLLVNP